jgi:protein dithiol oxidoreductase (disulfide-forming)
VFSRARNNSWFAGCWLALALIALPVAGQPAKRDVDYRLISAPRVASDERVEVIDFFFYACPYCNELAPLLDLWLKRKPPDVVFRRVPVVRHDSWIPLAKIYYTLEAMGEAGRLHGAVFHSYHDENLAMSQGEVIAAWAERHGLDADKFMAVYRSEEVLRKVEGARKMTRDYDIQSLPSLVVDGRYLTSSSMTRSVPQVISVLDDLIRLAREQRPAGKSQ